MPFFAPQRIAVVKIAYLISTLIPCLAVGSADTLSLGNPSRPPRTESVSAVPLPREKGDLLVKALGLP